MSKLTAGIVGLPNVGKSTLFNAITNSKIESANYPFATIEPNVGVVEVPDDRLSALDKVISSKKVVPAVFEFTDIAGLVKGASQGEGLGNQFLSNIRETDAIIHVVRCFEDGNIIHVHDKINPVNDITTINLELIFADLEVVEKRIARVSKKAQLKDKEALAEFNVLEKAREVLADSRKLISEEWEENELALLKHFQLITLKSMIYVANLSEDEVGTYTENQHYQDVLNLANEEGTIVIPICAKIEEELASMSTDEKMMFLSEMGVEKSGLDLIIVEAYKILNLRTYFTAGEIEVRAWTFHEGMKAPQCAGVIHTDFEKGFIKAEVVAFQDFVDNNGWQGSKEGGKVRLEGKEYEMNDGDVVFFKFNN